MPEDELYECPKCGRICEGVRSLSMHLRTAHNLSKEEAMPTVFPTEEHYKEREVIREPTAEREVSKPKPKEIEPTPKPQPKNVIFIVWGIYGNEIEARSELDTFLLSKPDLRDFSEQDGRYVKIRCTTRDKAEVVSVMLAKYTRPDDMRITTEPIPEEEGISGGTAKKVKDEVVKTFKQVTGSGRKRKENPEKAETSKNPDIIGETVSADDYRKFQRSEASATDIQSLSMLRQAIAKGERPMGTNVMKWVGAILALLIGVIVAWYMFQEIILKGGISLPFIGGGGGGGAGAGAGGGGGGAGGGGAGGGGPVQESLMGVYWLVSPVIVGVQKKLRGTRLSRIWSDG